MRTALLTSLALLIAAAPAQAAATKVTWPANKDHRPGEQIAVVVKADHAVKVSVLRVTDAGKVMSTVARKSLKSGTVTATLANAGSYSLRVQDGNRVRTRALKVVAPTPTVDNGCGDAHAIVPSVQPTLSATTVHPGQTLRYSILNTSVGCVSVGLPYRIEWQQPDGNWKIDPWGLQAFPLPAFVLGTAKAFDKLISVPADAAPGHYRLVEPLASIFPEFDVVA
jgi:hypothetical protein